MLSAKVVVFAVLVGLGWRCERCIGLRRLVVLVGLLDRGQWIYAATLVSIGISMARSSRGAKGRRQDIPVVSASVVCVSVRS